MKKNNTAPIEYFEDADELYMFLMNEIEDVDNPWVTVATDSDTAKELLFNCMNGGYGVEFIDINDWEYDDLYYVTIDNDTVNVEQAKFGDNYLFTDGELYIDCNAEHSNEYIRYMAKKFGDDYEMHRIGVGCEDDTKVYEYENHYEDMGVYAEIMVSSNVKDYVDIVKEFFEDYFCD